MHAHLIVLVCSSSVPINALRGGDDDDGKDVQMNDPTPPRSPSSLLLLFAKQQRQFLAENGGGGHLIVLAATDQVRNGRRLPQAAAWQQPRRRMRCPKQATARAIIWSCRITHYNTKEKKSQSCKSVSSSSKRNRIVSQTCIRHLLKGKHQ